MSVQLTYNVTRKFAKKAIKLKLKKCTNEQLEQILEIAIHNGFYNFNIVSDEDFEKNKISEYPHKFLEDLNNLPKYNNVF